MKLSSKILVVAFVAAIALVAVSANAAGYQFTRTLKVGSTGADVMSLQQVLNASADTQVAVTGAGSPGHESSYFGGLTKAAVIKFQNKYAAQILTPVGLTSGTGLVGASTRALLNNWSTVPVTTVTNCAPGQIYNPSTGALCTTGTVVTSGPVSVALAATPSYGALVSPSATAQLASFTFTGNGTVSNLSFQRTGVSSDQTLSNVYLYNGSTRITDAASVSNGIINFNNTAGLFSVNGSMTVTVRADIASSYGGNTIGISLLSYAVVGGTPVTANIAGPVQNVASNTNAATVYIQSGLANAGVNPVAGSVNAGTSNYTVFSVPVSVGTRSVYLESATFRYIGSAPANALANIGLYVDGAKISSGSINSQSNLVFDLSAAPLTLQTGGHTVEVRADVIGGAYRNFQLSLQNSGDLMVADSQLQGVNVAPYTSVSGSGTDQSPYVYTFSPVQAGLVTIAQGTLSITNDPSFTTQTTVTGGASNVPIAQFKVTAYGEDVKVNTLKVNPTFVSGTPTPADGTLNNVSIFVNGAQIGSNQNLVSTSSGLVYQLGSSLVIPAGTTVTLTVKADTINTSNVAYSVGNLQTVVTIPVGDAQGVQSGQLYPINSDLTSTNNSLSVGSGAATIAKNTSLSNQTYAPNTTGAKIASFSVQAGSSEGLRLNNIAVYLVGSNLSNSATISNVLNNLVVNVNGVAVGTPIGSVSGTNNFSINNVTVPANISATVDVFANINNYTGSFVASTTVSAQGLVSNLSTSGSATGQTTTIGSGTLSAPQLESVSPVSQFVIGGGNFQVATYNLISTTTPANVSELYFTVTNPSAVGSVTVSAPGATAVTTNVSGTSLKVTGLNLPIANGFAGIDVSVTPHFNMVDGVNLSAGTVSTTTLTGYKVTIGNTTTSTTTLSVPANGMIMVGGLPSLNITSPSTKLGSAAALTEIADISVTANASGGPIRIKTLPLTFSTSANAVVASSSSTTPSIEVDVNGIAVAGVTYSDMAVINAAGSNSVTLTFPGLGYTIVPSQGAVVFQVKATVSTSGSPTAGQASVATKLGTIGSFQWADVSSNNASLTGTGLLGTQYPTGSATITN